MKKILPLMLVTGMAISMCVPTLADNKFTDVKDENIMQNVEVLSMMGVVGGDQNGNFNPYNSLTRAEFCKMAMEIMGRGDEEYIYRNRTIFPDVRSNHWARGYINLAVCLENKIIIGNGDGTFAPNDSITYAQAVTMVMRILGYSDADAGMLWPQGYMEIAAEAKITEGLALGYNEKLSRADATKLFCNLLSATTKDGADYAATFGTAYPNVILMSDDAVSDNGKSGAIATSMGNYLAKNGETPSSFVGERGTLIVDNDGFAITFVPDSGENKNIVVSSAQAGYIKDNDGNKYDIPSDTKAYTTDEISTYGELWMDINNGTRVTLYYTKAGKIDGVFINTGSYDTSAVAYDSFSGNPFTQLLNGEKDYEIYKNGQKASVGDIERYDVATYDKSSKILYVTDTKLTAVYENAYPNTISPSSVTVMGKKFDVLPSAVSELSKYGIGQNITLLLTGDLKVAGVVSSGTVRSNAIGIVTECSETSANVELFIGITVEGDPNMSAERAESMRGQLVTVSSTTKGRISLSKLSGSTAGNMNVADNTVGGAKISANAKYFEQIGNGELKAIDVSDILVKSIPSSDIKYVNKNYAGEISIIVFDDVTGDGYTYGIAEIGETSSSLGTLTAKNDTVSVTNISGSTAPVISGTKVKDGDFIGIAPSLDGVKAAGIVVLDSVSGVSRSAFSGSDTISVKTKDGTFIVSDDVACYNAVTESWFSSLDEARSFSDNLHLYYDKDADDGGKIRIVVAK